MSTGFSYRNCLPCARCGRVGTQVWVYRNEPRWCQVCRNIPPETTEWFKSQIALAKASLTVPQGAMSSLRPKLEEALAQVVRKYEEDPVLAGEACAAWLKVLDVPELVVTVVAVDLLPPTCLRPDMSYLRARALTERDGEGPKPIPGVRFE